jgi:hypothetical protein
MYQPVAFTAGFGFKPVCRSNAMARFRDIGRSHPSTEVPQVPATSTTRRDREPVSATGSRPATIGTARRGPPPEIEGLTSAQVEQRLGASNRRVVGGDGVTVWVYQNGALIVYFYKDRASLKPPR